MKNLKTKSFLLTTAALIVAAAAFTTTGSIAGNGYGNGNGNNKQNGAVDPNSLKTKTPIKHLVVIFNENVSFDHYIGTYPNALNPEGEPPFEPAKNTPRDANNLLSSPALLHNNPNLNPLNGPTASNPFRLARTQAASAHPGHAYTPAQQ